MESYIVNDKLVCSYRRGDIVVEIDERDNVTRYEQGRVVYRGRCRDKDMQIIIADQ